MASSPYQAPGGFHLGFVGLVTTYEIAKVIADCVLGNRPVDRRCGDVRCEIHSLEMFLGPHELQRSEQRKQPALVVLQVTLRDQIAAQTRPFHLDVLVHLLASIPELAETVEAADDSDVLDTCRARIIAAAAVRHKFVGICPRTQIGPRHEMRASFVHHPLSVETPARCLPARASARLPQGVGVTHFHPAQLPLEKQWMKQHPA
jgi:hypothetical protein